jgi:hypothetical protein
VVEALTHLDVVGERGLVQVAHELVGDGPELVRLHKQILRLYSTETISKLKQTKRTVGNAAG